MELSNVTVLLARQRSGTNALRDVLDSHPQLFCLPEVFQAQPSPKARYEVEANYFNFLDERRDEIKGVLTSEEAQEALFIEWLAHLKTFSEKPQMVVDIKYNSAHNVDAPWRDLAAEPTLFAYIRRHGIRVLNLRRRNYLRYYLSWLKTEQTRKYHLHASGPDGAVKVEDEGIELDLDEMFFRLELCRNEDQLIHRMLGGYANYMAIEYEELFPRIGEPPADAVLEQVAEWMGIGPDFTKVQPRYRKQSVLPLEQAITNFGEVAEALRGTEFEYVLEDEPTYRAAAAETATA
jgi:LPS sulfotransferase NodH